MTEPDFNHIKEWLMPKIKDMGLRVEEFAGLVPLSRAAIYNYFEDRNRPDEQTMAKICKVLGVPLEEGLRQYTKRAEGRRKGYKPPNDQMA